MKRTQILRVLLTIVIVSVVTPEVSAHYRPGLGRWVERDPAGYVDSQHLYQYAEGNPATFLDSHGLSTRPDCFRATTSLADCNACCSKRYLPDPGTGSGSYIKWHQCRDACRLAFGKPSEVPGSAPSTPPEIPDLIFTITDLISPGYCGDVHIASITGCKARLKWTGDCGLIQGAIALQGGVCTIAQGKIAQNPDQSLSCAVGEDCCNKTHYSGCYDITVHINACVPTSNGKQCCIAGALTATICFEGDIGTCCTPPTKSTAMCRK